MQRTIKAVIFDMDKVLVDSEPHFIKRTDDFFQMHHVKLPKEALDLTVGSTLERSWENLMQYSPVKWELEDYAEQYRSYVNQFPIPYESCLNPTAKQTLEQLVNNGFMVSLASSTSMEGIHRMLDGNHLRPYFKTILSGKMFRESKPNPEIYLKSAQLLHLEPEECLVVEDSRYGIEAGLRANMTVVAKKDDRFGVDQSKAHYFIDQLIDLLKILEEIKKTDLF